MADPLNGHTVLDDPSPAEVSLRSRLLAGAAIIVSAATAAVAVYEIWTGNHLISATGGFALSELHMMIHSGMLGAFHEDFPNISKYTLIIGSAGLLAASGNHLKHAWANGLKEKVCEQGIKAAVPKVTEELASHAVLCTIKLGKFIDKLSHTFFTRRSHSDLNFNGIP